MNFGGVDVASTLSVIPLPDPEMQRKYDAMGLPDPVAFAALTALGAIPKPMEMVKAMMLAAQDQVNRQTCGQECNDAAKWASAPLRPAMGNERTATFHDKLQMEMPPGKSFIEAFHEMQQRQQEGQTVSDATITERAMPSGPLSSYAAAAQRVRNLQPSMTLQPPQYEFEASSVADEAVERLEERIAKSAQELAEQAKVAADRAREAAQTAAQTAAANRDASSAVDLEAATRAAMAREAAAPNRGVAQIFSRNSAPPKTAAAGAGTLSSLLTGRSASSSVELQQGSLAVAAAEPGATGVSPAPEKLRISRLPPGVTDSAVRLECARHGAVTSVLLDNDGSTAYVTFAAPDMAASALRRIGSKPCAFGTTAEVPVRLQLVNEIPDSVRLAPLRPAVAFTEPADLAELPEHLRPRAEKKRKRQSRSSKRRHQRSAGRRKRRRRASRSAVRWLDRSRSNSHTATGQYIKATGCSSTVRWWEKKRSAGGSSGTSGSRGGSSCSNRSRTRKGKQSSATRQEDPSVQRPRQVAVRGHWAQFVAPGGKEYYHNVLTGRTTWDRPADFDSAPSSRRPSESASAAALAALGASGVAGMWGPGTWRATGALL